MSLLRIHEFFKKAACFLLLAACLDQCIQFKAEVLRPHNLYSLITLILVTIYLLLSNRNNSSKNDAEFSKTHFVTLILAGVLLVVFKVGEITKLSLWWDELFQLRHIYTMSFMDATSTHIQPPSPYILQRLFVSTFGVSDWAVRASSFVFSGAGCFLLLALIMHKTKNSIIAVLLTSLLIFEPWFLNYSVDARAVSIGFFFLVLFFTELYLLLSEFLTSNELIAKKRILSLCCVSFLFLMSLSMQPPLILLGLFLSCLLFYFKQINSPIKKNTNFVLKALAISVILFLPVQYRMHIDHVHKFSVFNTTNIFNRLSDINWNLYEPVLNMLRPFIILSAICLFIGLLLKFKSSKNVERIYKIFSYSSLIFINIVFLFLSYLIFLGLVQYGFSPHYVLLALPIFIMAVAVFYADVHSYLKNSLKKTIWSWVFVISIALSLPWYNLSLGQINGETIGHEDLKSAYQVILKTSTGQDVFISLSLPKKNWNPVEANIGSWNYYYNQKGQLAKNFAESSALKEFPLIWLYNELKANRKADHLYIVNHRMYNQVPFRLQDYFSLDRSQLWVFDFVEVIQVKTIGSDLKSTWFDFLKKLEADQSLKESWVLSFMLLQKNLLQADKESFMNNYKTFVQNIEGADNQPNIEIIKHFLKRESVSVFGDLNL